MNVQCESCGEEGIHNGAMNKVGGRDQRHHAGGKDALNLKSKCEGKEAANLKMG